MSIQLATGGRGMMLPKTGLKPIRIYGPSGGPFQFTVRSGDSASSANVTTC